MTLFTRLKIRHALRRSIKRMRRLGVEECRLVINGTPIIAWESQIDHAARIAKATLRKHPFTSVILIPASPPKEIIV